MAQGFSGKLVLVVLVSVAGTMMVAESAFGERNKVEKAAAVRISIEEAIKTASEKVLGTVIEAELEQKHDQLIWEVEVVTSEKKVMEVHIDAETGTVIDVEEEKVKSKRVHRRN
jgi:uncharacterized membrane protein YkoI